MGHEPERKEGDLVLNLERSMCEPFFLGFGAKMPETACVLVTTSAMNPLGKEATRVAENSNRRIGETNNFIVELIKI